MKSFRYLFKLLAQRRASTILGSLLFATTQSPGLTFNVTYDSTVTSSADSAAFQNAFNFATQAFSNLYSDPITVNIIVKYDGTDFAKSAIAQLGYYTYDEMFTNLSGDAKSADDATAIANLPAVGSNPAPTNRYAIARAEAKALGLSSDVGLNDTNRDGTITIGTNSLFSFDPQNRAVSNKYDFIGTAEHEISEVLGRYSLLPQTNLFLAYDLFRFTAKDVRSFSPADTNVFFSIDKGATAGKYFNSVVGDDFGDWVTSSDDPDSFNARAFKGVINDISAVDKQTLDVIGYDIVPEPGSIAVMGAGFLLFMLCKRRRVDLPDEPGAGTN